MPPVRPDSNTKWFAYGYGDEIIFGFASPFHAESEQFNFDTIMANPRMLSSFLALEFRNAEIRDLELFRAWITLATNPTDSSLRWLSRRISSRPTFS
jgi:hypothetical protein